MPSLTLPDRLIWFAHCPKAGGTTIEQFMVAQWGDAVGHLHWGWDLWWRKGGWRVTVPPNSPQHLIWDDALKVLPSRPDLVFAVIRDPVSRMQSEHRWQRHLRRGTWVGRGLAWLPFGLWLKLMLELAARHPHALDNHLRPQSAFVPDGAKVFRLEDGMEPVFCWLTAQTGIAYEPQPSRRTNATGSARQVSGAEATRIAVAFAEDYARFGYAPPDTYLCHRSLGDVLAAGLAPGLAWLDRRGCL